MESQYFFFYVVEFKLWSFPKHDLKNCFKIFHYHWESSRNYIVENNIRTSKTPKSLHLRNVKYFPNMRSFLEIIFESHSHTFRKTYYDQITPKQNSLMVDNWVSIFIKLGRSSLFWFIAISTKLIKFYLRHPFRVCNTYAYEYFLMIIRKPTCLLTRNSD